MTSVEDVVLARLNQIAAHTPPERMPLLDDARDLVHLLAAGVPRLNAPCIGFDGDALIMEWPGSEVGVSVEFLGGGEYEALLCRYDHESGRATLTEPATRDELRDALLLLGTGTSSQRGA